MAHVRHDRRLWTLLAVMAGVSWLLWALFSDPSVSDTGEGRSTPEEEAMIEEIKELALASIDFAAEPDHFHKRDAHPAPHGCVKAWLTVDPEIEERFRHGVFARPGHRYPTWVRFSNGLRTDDRQLDVRGMAMKLMDVPGEKLLHRGESTQDFVMINYHTFVVPDVAEFLPFFERQVAGDPFGYFIGWNPFEWRLRELRVGLQMLAKSVLKQDGPSPLAMSYFSMLPYDLGRDLKIKFSVWPCDVGVTGECVTPETGRPTDPSEQFLREQLIADLTPPASATPDDRPAGRFEFRVQVQEPSRNMPIENASITWLQELSPYVRVAELTIAHQRFSTEEQNRFCENLSFNPWHALPAHRPIGGLNRARHVMYNAISEARHEANGVARHEPRGFCLRLDGLPCASELAAGDRP
jgi:hypothetical protein